MRRWLAVAAIGCALALSACSLPAGVDGNMVDDWPALPTPQAVVPVAGDCYQTALAYMLDNAPVPCQQFHLIEVAYVGTFTGTDATGSQPPAIDSTARRDAYAACVAPAKAFLGGDWHTGQLLMTVAVPDADAWSGGQRWFRCDVSELTSSGSQGVPITSTQDLKGVLSGPNAQVLTCVNWDDHGDYINNFRKASCAAKHSGEFAGIYTASDLPWLTSSSARTTLATNGCISVVAKFLGFSSAKTYASATVGYAWNNFDEDQWKIGDRGIRCFAAAFTKDKKFVGSVKGIRGATAKG